MGLRVECRNTRTQSSRPGSRHSSAAAVGDSAGVCAAAVAIVARFSSGVSKRMVEEILTKT